MHYVKSKDKRTGITYVYESESYWDKEKQQPRAHRKLIGKLDEETGQIVPTDGRGRKRKDRPQEEPSTEKAEVKPESPVAEDFSSQIQEKDLQIQQLTAEIEKLQHEKEEFLKALQALAAEYEEQNRS